MKTDATDIPSDAALPELMEQALLRERIDYLYKNTDFALTLFRHLTGYAIVAADLDGNVVAFNEGARRAFGYTPEEVIGRQRIELFFPRDFIEAGKLQQAVAAVLANEQFSYEGEMLRRGDQTFPAHAVLTLTKDVTGKMVGVVLMAEDITERKQAQARIEKLSTELEQRVVERAAKLEAANQALAESEYRFRTILESAGEGIMVADIQTRQIIMGNRAICDMLGYRPEDLNALRMDDIPPVKAVPEALRQFELQLKGESRIAPDMPLKRQDGSVVFADVTSAPITLAERKCLVGTFHDTTRRKNAEAELKLFRALIDNSNDSIEVVDPTSLRILDMNEKACRDLGYSREEMRSLHVFDIEVSIDRSAMSKVSAELERSGSTRLEGVHRRKDGSVFPVEINTKLVELDKTYVLSIARDITERKLAEASLRKSNRALQTLGKCNALLVRAETEERILQGACRTIIEAGGYDMAWIGYAEQDEGKTVRPVASAVASAGAMAKFFDGAAFTWADNALGQCPAGVAIRTGKMVTVADIVAEPQCEPWRERARRCGFVSVIALPLLIEGRAFGALMIFASERNAFNEDEILLLGEMAGDFAYGVAMLRTRAERDQGVKREHAQAVKLRQTLEQTIGAIALTLEKRDPYAAGHQQRVARLATAIATAMNLPPQQVEGVHFGALLHNIGTVAVPVEILNRPSKLSDLQLSMVKVHPRIGFEIVKDIPFPWPVAQMVLQHHERMDGSGYPQGLKGEQIMLEARILAVADVLEAMLAYRPYRTVLGIDAALDTLTEGRGTEFDPAVVDACLRVVKQPGYASAS